MEISTATAEDTEAVGQQLAGGCQHGCTIYLSGELGAGKTTLVRGFLRAFGHSGTVKSPTYTLVEPYELVRKNVYHFDLYRLADPGELEHMGIRDYLEPENCCLVEWPERGQGVLPAADVDVHIDYCEGGRRLSLTAHTARGEVILAQVSS